MDRNLKSTHKKFKKEAKKTLYKGLDTKKRKLEPRLTYLEELSSHLSLPPDIIAGAPIITAYGRNEICMENYKGIIEYNDKLVKVQAKSCKICIEGRATKYSYTLQKMR